MGLKYFLMLIVALYTVHQISAFALNRCGHTGTDVCGCQGVVPRPKHVPRVNFLLPQVTCVTSPPSQSFQPIGDACGCGSRSIRPAAQSRPPCPNKPGVSCSCTSHGHTTPAPSCGCVEDAASDFSAYSSQDSKVYYFEAKKPAASSSPTVAPKVYPPADSISIMMARKQSRNAANIVPERTLAYGPDKDVIDGHQKPIVQTMNEESIYQTKGKVLELRNFRSESSEEEEFTTTTTKKPKRKPFVPHKLTYDNLGYSEADWNNKNYVVLNMNQNVQPSSKRHPIFRQRKAPSCSSCQKPKGKCGCKDQAAAQSQISEQEASFETSDSQWST